jgi:phosphate transport system substrate-binding protein
MTAVDEVMPAAGAAAAGLGFGRQVAVRSAAVLVAILALAAGVVLVARAAEPTDPRLVQHSTPPRTVLSDDTCVIAGSGSNLPLVQRLVDAYRTIHPEAHIVVHRSIGSWGGAHAVADGVVHIGLASRALKADERRNGTRSLAHVSVAVVLGANPRVVDASLTSRNLASLVRGDQVHWTDGTPAVLLEREPGDSSYKVLHAKNPLFRAAQLASGGRTHWRVLLHDAEMAEALAETPGAVGLADLGVISLSGKGLRVIRIDGLDPTSPRYPYLKDLDFVVRGKPRGLTARFLSFALGDTGRTIAIRAGYRPRF